MAASDAHDVLLLNSDTEVANDWLDRLRAAAYSDARVARSRRSPTTRRSAAIRASASPTNCRRAATRRASTRCSPQANAGQVVDVPTGVGFCMYIRRDSLDAVGLFDVENFGKGYGEENDFCRRAAEAGWRNLHALDTFVLHTGGVSFGDSKSQRETRSRGEAAPAAPELRPPRARLRPGRPGPRRAPRGRPGADRAPRACPACWRCCTTAAAARCGMRRTGGAPAAEAVVLLAHSRAGQRVRLELLEPGAGFRLEFALPGEWDVAAAGAAGAGHRPRALPPHAGSPRRSPARWASSSACPGISPRMITTAMCPQISLTDNERPLLRRGRERAVRALPARNARSRRSATSRPGARATAAC